MFSKHYIPACLWGMLILCFSLMPGNHIPEVQYWYQEYLDIFIHFTFYFAFGFLMMIGTNKQYTHPMLRYYSGIFTITIGTLYGGVLEVVQKLLIINRTAEFADFFANFMGCVTGVMLFRIIYFNIKMR